LAGRLSTLLPQSGNKKQELGCGLRMQPMLAGTRRKTRRFLLFSIQTVSFFPFTFDVARIKM
jgi:hypothetical protein